MLSMPFVVENLVLGDIALVTPQNFMPEKKTAAANARPSVEMSCRWLSDAKLVLLPIALSLCWACPN